MRKMNLENLQFPNHNTILDKRLKPARPIKRAVPVERTEPKIPEGKVVQENKPKVDKKLLRLILIGLACEAGILGIHTVQAQSHKLESENNSRPTVKQEAKKENLEKEKVNLGEKVKKINSENILVKHPEFIKAINDNIPFYKKAAEKHNVPWELLAAVHFRETNFETGPTDNGQGPFQIYTQPSGCQDFEKATNIAAQMLQEKVNGKLTENTTDLNLIEKVGALYNGWEQICVIEAKKQGLQPNQWFKFKSYSMNNLDEEHQNMIVQLRDNVPINLNDKSTYTYDKRDGVLKVFDDLKGARYNNDGFLLESQL